MTTPTPYTPSPQLAPSDAPTEVDDEISLLDLFETLAENLRLLVLGPLLVGVVALALTYLTTPTFTANTSFLPPQQQSSSAASVLSSLSALGGLSGMATAAGIKNPNDQFIAMMQSRATVDVLIKRFDLLERYETEVMQVARDGLAARTRISAGKDGLISVEVDDHSPQFAADLANAHVEELGRLLDRLAITEVQQRRVFFERQLEETRDKLVSAQLALQQVGMDASVLRTQPETQVSALAALEAQVTAQEVKIAGMRGFLNESAPDMQQAMMELKAMQAQVSKASKSQTSQSIGPEQVGYVQRYRDYRYFETLFELFSKQLEIAKIDEAREGAVIQVLDYAVAPDFKSKPKRALTAVLATLASGFVLLLWVFVRKALLTASQDPQTQEQLQHISRSLKRAIWR